MRDPSPPLEFPPSMDGNAGAGVGYFQDAFDHRIDITGEHLAISEIPRLLSLSAADDQTIVDAIRSALAETGGLGACTDLARDETEAAADLYRRDRIAAIDGTNSISPTRLVTETVYGAGVVAVTPRSQNTPRSKATATHARTSIDPEDATRQ